MEEWRDIEGYEGFYQVSNFGRIKSLERVVMGKAGLMRLKEKIIKQGDNGGGYPRFVLCKERGRKSSSVHRLVAKAFIPNPENKPYINHIDGDKSNSNASNLEWCTNSENIKHAVVTGLLPVKNGEKHPLSILRGDQIVKIRKLKGSDQSIANIYGVSRVTIWSIRNRKTWRHI